MNDLFDKDITIINKYMDKMEKKTKYKISYVKGFWSSSNGISINGTQLTKADGLIAKILINDDRNKRYQTPTIFQESQEELTVGQVNQTTLERLDNIILKSLILTQECWTLQPDDYLVKGIVKEFTTIQKLLTDYQEVMKITDIKIKDYGSEDIWHFAITGA